MIVLEAKGLAGTIQLGSQSYNWSRWNGQQLSGHFALDTETELITDHEIPRLAMVSASDGQQHALHTVGPNDRRHATYDRVNGGHDPDH